MNTLHTGIVGCGKVGHIHASALRNLNESHFTAVCDLDMDRAKSFAQTYNVKAYNDVKEMITDADIDAVVVGTPHPFHAAPTIAALEAGAHVIVEKPLASCLEDCDAMITVAKEKDRQLAVISQRRFYAPVRRVKMAIDEGKLGKPVIGMVHMLGWRDKDYYESDVWRGTWKGEGGGVLVNQAPHQLDLLQWFMGPVDELYGYWDNFNHDYIEVEDTALAVLRFKNGSLGNILVSNAQNPALYGKVFLHGKNGTSVSVQTDGGAMFIAGMSAIQTPPVNDLWQVPGEENFLGKWQEEDTLFFETINPMEYYHQLQIQDFLRAIIDSYDPMITGVEGRKTVEIFTAIYRSQRDHAPITFPLYPETNRDDFDGRHRNTNRD